MTGDGSDFHPGRNWGATPPGYSACVRVWRWLAPHYGTMPAQTYSGSPESWKNMGILAGVADCGRSWKWGCRRKLVLGFKPRNGSHAREGLYGFWRERGNHMALGLPSPHSLGSWDARCSSNAELFLSSLEECRRNAVGRKGVKGLLLVGQEKLPCRFELRTGDRDGDTADGAGN